MLPNSEKDFLKRHIGPSKEDQSKMLKELKLAEARGTGIRKVFKAMLRNGSPPPIYEFDDERTYFTVILPAHPNALKNFFT